MWTNPNYLKGCRSVIDPTETLTRSGRSKLGKGICKIVPSEPRKAHKQLPAGDRYPKGAHWPCSPEMPFTGLPWKFNILTGSGLERYIEKARSIRKALTEEQHRELERARSSKRLIRHACRVVHYATSDEREKDCYEERVYDAFASPLIRTKCHLPPT
jgi:hypothetical protein